MRADRLRNAMTAKSVTQAELARRAGVSAATIQQLLNGSIQTTRSLRAIAAALTVSADWLEGLPDTTPIEDVPSAAFKGDNNTVYVGYLGSFDGVGEQNRKTGLRTLTLSSFWFDAIAPGLKPNEVSFAQVRTDEMSSTLMRGDDICYRHATKHDGDPDGIWLLTYYDKGLIRRVRPLKAGGYQISGDNPVIGAFEAFDNEIEFEGKIVWQGRTLR